MKKSTKTIVLSLLVMALWGSLFPMVKLGYGALGISSKSVPDILMFASYRFVIAEGSRTYNGLKCHFCPSLRYLHREIRPVCPCISALT